jgi:hypothetical protein
MAAKWLPLWDARRMLLTPEGTIPDFVVSEGAMIQDVGVARR